ncbi:MAG: fumarylacetoacetate hydrolase family protein [Candidatus Bathyarchaeia archaeon]
MKLARCVIGSKESYGLLDKNKIVCLPQLAKKLNKVFPPKLEDLVALGAEGIKRTEKLLQEAAAKEVAQASFAIAKCALKAPIPRPAKIICLGLNYRDHAVEQGKEVPEEPVIFMKPYTAIIGPHEKIVKPSFVKQLDYEAELAIIIGRKAKNVPVSKAKEHIFGYTILNDVSARDIQFKDKQWTRGKSFDTFAPTGPFIVTANELDTADLRIRTWVNGELRQDSTTKNMVFKPSEIVYHLSRVMTLEPCDIIATGTPAGVGFAMKPKPKFLEAGDTVKIEIEGIGVLENKVVEASSS